ncbi:hypothetical protein Pst134EB_012281 [Puccinia striiformis f. sp. tritici]|nr:hypothetical protein Pst134EB_012281 [Puccinia striiformis f. sp. tritici]
MEAAIATALPLTPPPPPTDSNRDRTEEVDEETETLISSEHLNSRSNSPESSTSSAVAEQPAEPELEPELESAPELATAPELEPSNNNQQQQQPSNQLIRSPSSSTDQPKSSPPPPVLPLTISPPFRSTNHTPPHAKTTPPSHSQHPISPSSTLQSTENNDLTRTTHLSPNSATLQFPQNMPGRSRRQLGEYSLGKTLGAGSMGKVKLAISSITNEKIAIKIIPRHTSLSAAQQQLIEKDKNNKENHHSSNSRRKSQSITPSASFIEKAKNKDLSKEIRTIREASIVLLLHHPYVCGMKSMLVYPHHYYMLFEYVNGGQMLDYIISHGRLRERAARKFARQMGSALEYCHANSIVHRDLKIENILISKTGNIKIIDFGLSNLFSPNSNLSTFCGSLYFAAPELLNAKAYIGPEVDVWSFGIVLFVLVCGKVPFDDQSMPALHAKIKRGQVDYPTWLSSECKHVLSRMLVTNPSNRASLTEVLNHPWMVKGFDGPPDPHIPHREPLRLSQIDPEVIKGMTGFEFGTEEKIEADLRAVLSSEMYLKVLKLYDDKRSNSINGSVDPVYNIPPSSSSTSMSPVNANKRDSKIDRDPNKTPTKSSKRFSGFGFYGKKVAGGLAAVLNTVGGTKNEDKSNSDPNSSISGFESVLLNGQTLDSLDPARGYHPLISIYFLVREKIERERIYGPGVFASSTLSVTGPPPPPAPPSAYMSELGAHGQLLASGIHTSNEIASVRLPNKNRNTMAGSELDGQQRDQAALLLDMHQKGSSSTKDRNRIMSIRPNTATERMVSTPLPSAPTSPSPTTEFASSRARTTNRFNPSKRRSVHVMTAPESSGVLQVMTAQRTPESNSNSNSTKRSDRVVSMVESGTTATGGGSDTERSPSGFARRFGSLLGRSASVNDPDFKRHNNNRPRSSIGLGHKSSSKTPLSALPQVTESTGLSPPFSPGGLQEQQSTATTPNSQDLSSDASPLSAPLSGQSGPMSTFSGAMSDTESSRTRPHHHQRGSSTGGGPESSHHSTNKNGGEGKTGITQSTSCNAGSSWRPRLTSLQSTKTKRPTTSQTNNNNNPGQAANTENVLSEDEGEGNPLDEDNDPELLQPLEIGSPDSTLPKLAAPAQPHLLAFSGRTASPSSKSSDKIKPIYLKGLFSVATTSTRGPQVLRADLVRVLNRIGFQHREIKGGFECAHAPSIDLSSYGGGSTSNTGAHNLLLSPPQPIPSTTTSSNQKSSCKKTNEAMKKKVSKASFGKKHLVNKDQNDSLASSSSKVNGSITPSTSGNNPNSDAPSEPSLNGGGSQVATPSLAGTESGVQSPALPMITTPGIGANETNEGTKTTSSSNSKNIIIHSQFNNGAVHNKKLDLVVRFEIFIVKMPLLPGISGLQFRRISGNAWQYQTFARRILQELKL